MKNVFACLVHESQEAVVDLVRNLTYLDPDSRVILYNGGRDPSLLRRGFSVDGHEPLIHPSPRPLRWGALHDFAIDCMRLALVEAPFDTLTIVDSDQLLIRPGYSAALAAFLDGREGIGMLGNAPDPQPHRTRVPPAVTAWRERDLWLPYCGRFQGGQAKFPHWTFWPSTVFIEAACRDLVRTFDEDAELARVLASSRLWATEEIVLPTLVALLGHAIARSPFGYDLVRYNVLATPRQLRAAMERPDLFWAHPVPRVYDHPLRRTIRARHREYQRAPTQGADMTAPTPLLRTLPILTRMRTVDGWLSDEEGDLLIAGVARALADHPGTTSVVEIGSYCGRSTTVLASVIKAQHPEGRVYAIDPHDGEVGALDRGLVRTPPTLARFRRNIAAAGLDDVVVTVRKRSWEVDWHTPIAFLFVDGLHDYANVSRDFCHFEPWLVEGGYVAFHDYADYYPGVKVFVDELLSTGGYDRVDLAASLVLLRRRAATTEAAPRRLEVHEPAPGPAPLPAASTTAPLVSCIMPTFNRPELVPRAVAGFLGQDYPHAELVVVDDGPDSLADVLPDDPRVHHLRLERRHSIGAKRNLGCEASRGDVIANWDDDDWYAPWRLSYEVEALDASGADVVGLDRLLYLEADSDRAWRYVWPARARPWVHDAALAFTRELWRRNPFPNTSMGIDCRFLWTPVAKRIKAVHDERFYVGIMHPGNTSPKNTRHGLWSPHPREAIEELMGADAALYREAPAAVSVGA